jgi:hypothetical protein
MEKIDELKIEYTGQSKSELENKLNEVIRLANAQQELIETLTDKVAELQDHKCKCNN